MIVATSLALGAAVLHAIWNLMVKTAPAGDHALSSWGIFVAGGIVVLPFVVLSGGPGVVTVPWLALSAVVHIGYISGLVGAYRHGDFSLAYPLARGSGATLAAIGAGVFMGDRLPGPAWVAIAVVALGLLGLVGGSVPTIAVRHGLATGLTIAAYTLADAQGARVSPNPIAYGLVTTSCAAVTITLLHVVRGRGRLFLEAAPVRWPRWAIGGTFNAVAYAMVMVATRYAEVGYVAMLRESSVVIAAFIGWRFLKEPLGGRRLVASAVVLVGLVGLVLARSL